LNGSRNREQFEVDFMRVLRIVGVVLIVIALAFTVMLVMGGMQPRAHTASVATDINAPIAVVWQRIEDTAQQPSWRTGLSAVQPMPAQNGHICWMEIQKMGKMPLCEVLTAAPNTRIVAIADPNLPYGGTWTYQLTETSPTTTHIAITENGTTGPWFFRFVGHYIFHEDTMIKQYEADLQKSAGTR
jgi:uncharacterized protein YndB with AHSA1/START domain